jgi:hypothetical protein
MRTKHMAVRWDQRIKNFALVEPPSSSSEEEEEVKLPQRHKMSLAEASSAAREALKRKRDEKRAQKEKELE